MVRMPSRRSHHRSCSSRNGPAPRRAARLANGSRPRRASPPGVGSSLVSMKATIIGAGAAGLSTAIALRSALAADVRILERGKEADKPGLGVALLPYAREMLRLKGFQSYADRFVPIDRRTEVF